MDDETDEILITRWFRIRWNDVLILGIGFDPNALILGIYLGPIGIYLGDAQEG